MMPKIRIEDVFDALPEAADLDKPQAMVEQWGTARHLCRVCRMSKSAMSNNLDKLHTDRRAHIADWAPPARGGQWAGIWVKGEGEHKPRPTLAPDPERDQHRRAVKISRQKARYENAQIGRGRELSRDTIERTRATGPRSWLSTLGDMTGVEL